MIGEPTVCRMEKARYAGKLGGRIKRPGPPDLAREIDDSFGAAEHLAFGRGNAHFAEQILGLQIEESLHARVLQGGQAEAARFERAAEAAGERGADAAVAIEENPAAGRMPSFRISYF